jgi:hypothetical protein
MPLAEEQRAELREAERALWKAEPAEMLASAGLTPDPWQVELLRAKERHILLNCCRGSGKTVSLLALHQALYRPDSTILIFAPTSRQSDEFLENHLFRRYKRLDKPIPQAGDKVSRLELANGSRVIPLPNNEEAIRTFHPQLVIVDEAARVPDALYGAITPMLKVTKGRLVVLSTPFGKRGFFYKEWIGQGRDDWRRFTVDASKCPRIDPKEIEQDRRSHGDPWVQQEYFCDFTQMEGIVYPSMPSAVVDALPAKLTGRVFVGVDWGWHNPAAQVVGILDNDDVLWLVEEVYGSHLTMDGELPGQTAQQRRQDFVCQAVDIAARHDVEMFHCDPAEPRSIEKFRRASLPAKEGVNDIMPGIQAVSARIGSGRLKVLRSGCPNLLLESELYRYPTAEERKIAGEKPIDEHNHALGALRYMTATIDRVREVKGRRYEEIEPHASGREPRPGDRAPSPRQADLDTIERLREQAETRDHLLSRGWESYDG